MLHATLAQKLTNLEFSTTIIYDFFRSKPFDRFMAKVNGLDRMTIGLWKDVRLRELVRFSGNIGFMSVALSFGLYYFFIYLE